LRGEDRYTDGKNHDQDYINCTYRYFHA
jgi:hypothetical protein